MIASGRRSDRRACINRLLIIFSGVICPVLTQAAHASVTVGDGGQATFSQSISVPPGRAGMEPKLSLVYSSSGVNGPAGLGWSIQGISQITRCAAINGPDGRRPVRYDAEDKLCLDGQRLIQYGGNASGYGGAAAAQSADSAAPATQREFRTESDAFNRIIAKGNVAGGPAYFKVWAKSGLITEYGAVETSGGFSGTDAQVTTVGHLDSTKNGVVSAWLVKRISDTLGNFIEFDYAQGAPAYGSGPNGTAIAGREWRLVKARYTGTRADPTTANSVEFVYNAPNTVVAEDAFSAYPRKDFSEAYHAGAKVVQTRLLRKVVVKNLNAVVREYRLTHSASTTTGRALITAIEECAGSGDCLPPISFSYTPGRDNYGNANQVGGVTKDNLVGDSLGVITGDFNGDGRTDLLRWHKTDPAANRLFLSSDRRAGSFAMLESGFNINAAGDKLGGDNVKTFTSDVNGDGLVDIVRLCRDTASCPNLSIWLSRGDGSFKPMTISGVPDALWPLAATVQYDWCLNDAETGSVRVAKYTGRNSYFRDLDGDGRTDILLINGTSGLKCSTGGVGTESAASMQVKHFRGTGNGSFVANQPPWTDPNWFQWPIEPKTTRGTEYPDWADVNGDALVDPLLGYGRINTGTGFAQSANTAFISARLVVDANGDGKPDVVSTSDNDEFKDSTPQLWINRGDGTFFEDSRGLAAVGGDGNFRFGSGAIGTLGADVNADGLQDFVAWDNTGAPTVWFAVRDPAGAVRYEKATQYPSRGLPNMYTSFFAGDFAGTGDTSLLMVEDGQLWMHNTGVSAGGDLLASVTNGAGLTTTIQYQTLAQPSTVPVYTNGRDTLANPEEFDPFTEPVAVAPPMWVVRSTSQGSATPSASGPVTVDTAFLYHGMKAAYGRGTMGFASVSKFFPYANGDLLATTTEYHQDAAQFQYIGLPVYTATYSGLSAYDTVTTIVQRTVCSATKIRQGLCDELGLTNYVTVTTKSFNPVNSLSGLKPVTRTDYAYCDLTASTTGGATAKPPSDGSAYAPPCTTTQRIRRPYQAQSVERTYDMASSALVSETVASNLEMSPFSEVKQSKVEVRSPLVAGRSGWVSTKLTVNKYDANNVGSWFLGRLTESRVTSTINAPQPTKTAGTAALATAVSGGASVPPTAPPLEPAVLSAILQLLLED